MKSKVRIVEDQGVRYQALTFLCPGCIAGGPDEYVGLHMLPVNNTVDINKPSWNWNGNLEKPTLSPSILTQGYSRCHSYLTEGVFKFLEDSDHPLAGKEALIPELPEWVENL